MWEVVIIDNNSSNRNIEVQMLMSSIVGRILLIKKKKYCLQVLENLSHIKPSKDKKTLQLSKANIYKYLTCKALQEPFSKEKRFLALKFLYKYFFNDFYRKTQPNFLIKLLLKILVIITLPASISTNLLSKIKVENPKKSFLQ